MVILGVLRKSDVDELKLNVVRLGVDYTMTAILPSLIVFMGRTQNRSSKGELRLPGLFDAGGFDQLAAIDPDCGVAWIVVDADSRELEGTLGQLVCSEEGVQNGEELRE